MAKIPSKWTPEKLKALKDFIDSGKSIEFIAAHFGVKINALRQVMFDHKIYVKKKESGAPGALTKLHKEKIKDYAYRLMVLKGEAVRKIEEIPPFTDEQLKLWANINQFCSDLLFWMGKPLVLLDYQKDVVDMIEKNKYSVILAGHQTGKDMIASAYVLWKCITTPNYFAIIVSPSQRQSDELFRRIQHFIAANDIYYSVKVSRADEIEFSNGSRVLSLPARGSITGLTHVHLIIINEAGRAELPESVINDCMPMTMAVDGKLALMGNPYSKTTQFYEHFQNPLFAKLHIKTSQNVSLPNLKEFLESEKKRCTKKEYLQRYEGIFADFENAFIRSNLLDQSVKEYDYSLKRNPDLKYYCGIDWGIKTDQSVLIVISKANDGCLKVEYARAWLGSLSKCSNQLAYLNEIFIFDKIVPEEAGISIDEVSKLKELYNNVKPFIPTNEKNFEGYKHLLKIFEEGLITIPMDEIKLIDQLRYLELKQTSTGKFRVDHPIGRHNDYTTALMLAVWSLREQQYSPGRPIWA